MEITKISWQFIYNFNNQKSMNIIFFTTLFFNILTVCHGSNSSKNFPCDIYFLKNLHLT